mmetsp:Transcript_10007/g.8958  ORF Transcript_10007/g.8958 Transcript_10007/m.8958 type:complete len:896 (-) Transcript_10007:86-2773(-)
MAGRGRDMTLPSWMTSEATVGNNSTDTQVKTENQTITNNNTNNNLNQMTINTNTVPPTIPSVLQVPPRPQIIPVPMIPMTTPSQPFIVPSLLPAGPVITNTVVKPTVITNTPISQQPMFLQPPQFAPNPQLAMPSFQPPMIPRPLPFQPMPFNPAMTMPALPRPASTSIGDPNNEQANWSAHQTPDGRKYWYNKVTLQSTYEKPFCLKTPEERSIPPCSWKEYFADGKKYYSNGKESTWEEPEEYRIWKEKIEAIENKKNTAQQNAAPVNKPIQSNNHNKVSVDKVDDKSKSIVASTPEPTYATHAQAVDAFMALLTEKKISSTAKSKEVKEICQDDIRWNALKTTGERNQYLAEYQTKKLKLEKEAKLIKAKKYRDSFLIMLAENTDIDAHTRWSDAMNILKEDIRYKNIEDTREKEDLFNEFISELIKKEREDRHKLKDSAFQILNQKLNQLKDDQIITRKTLWADSKDLILSHVRCPEIKILDDLDIKRAVQDAVSKLDLIYKENEKQIKQLKYKQIEEKQIDFHKYLEYLSMNGILLPTHRWHELLTMNEIIQSNEYIELINVSKPIDSNDKNVYEKFPGANAKEVYEKVIIITRDLYRNDRKVIRNVLDELNYNIKYTTTYDEFKEALLKFASMKEVVKSTNVTTESNEQIDKNVSTKDIIEYIPDMSLTEDGEEIDDIEVLQSNGRSKKSSSLALDLRHIFIKRPKHIQVIFNEIFEHVKTEHEEELKRIKRREDRYIELLEEYFYRSDHIDVTWEDAKRLLEKHSAYDAINRNDRKALFYDYISELKKKMEEKTKNIKSSTSELTDKQVDNPLDKHISKSIDKDDGSSSDGEVSDDDSLVDNKSDKKSKKEKSKKDKHKKDKKHKRQRSDSRLDDEEDKRKRNRSVSH